jgi:hypothetical protein
MTTLLMAMWVLAAEPEKVDVSAQLKKMRVYSDGKNHFIAFARDKEQSIPSEAFYGDGKSFYKLRAPGYGGDRDSWSISLWDPRLSNALASLIYKEGEVSVECQSRKTALKELGVDDAKALASKAAFYGPRWKRMPRTLLRDDKGTYYFVDQQRDVPGMKDVKLYMGPRGKLKQQQMVNIVSDTQGDIFSTKNGDLRLIANQYDYRWVKGKKEVKLTQVSVEDNHVLIYTDLGVYEGMPLGTPCDDL